MSYTQSHFDSFNCKQEIRLGPAKGKAMIKTLDEDNIEKAMYKPDEFINKSLQPIEIINNYLPVRLNLYAIAIIYLKDAERPYKRFRI